MLDRIQHREVLFSLLKDIYRSSEGAFLGFKGGTMLYFFYQLDRFSVDLDFDLLPGGSSEDIMKRFRKIFSRYGTLEDSMDKRYTLFFLLRYEAGKHAIKIDISKREQPFNHYETKNFYGTDIITLTLTDSFAHKLVALTERKGPANRDFYDIYFLLKKGIPLSEEIIQNRTGLTVSQYLEKVILYTRKNISPNSILEGIGDLVEENKKDWLKKEFKEDLLSRLEFRKDQLSH
jgi:predicted nucleotidyltransferase component of viral defense system